MISLVLKGVVADIKEVFRLLREEGFRETARVLNSKDAPGLVQFAKYGICGVASVITLSIVAYLMMAKFGFPVDFKDNPDLSPEKARSNYLIAESVAFVFANFTAYFLNVLWVFTPGRHSKLKEFTIFTAVAAFSFVAGIIPSLILFAKGGVPVLAHILLIVTSALVNFVCRKFLVFSR